MNIFNRKKNILVTGAKGQLGSYLVRELTCMSMKQQSCINKVFGIDIDDLDLRNSFDVADYFNTNVSNPNIKLDYVIHCAAATNTSAIEQDPCKYYAANVLATKNIADSCRFNNIKLIYISTDYVFSEFSYEGCGGILHEFPVNQYGMQKLLAEKYAELAYANKPKDLLIGRLSWLFGNSSSSFVEKLLVSITNTYMNARNKSESEKICHKVANDAFGKPTPTWLVLNRILDSIENQTYGIRDFQFNNNQISRFKWATIIWNAFCNAFCANVNEVDKIIFDMTKRIELVGACSRDLNLNMMHPGLIKHNVISSMHDDLFDFDQSTIAYIHENFNRIYNTIVVEVINHIQ